MTAESSSIDTPDVNIVPAENGFIITARNTAGGHVFVAPSKYHLMTRLMNIYGYTIQQLINDGAVKINNYDHLEV